MAKHNEVFGDSLSHCESAVKESEEQIRAMPCHTHKCDRDRYAAWLITRYVITDDELLLLFKLMSKDYHREVMKCLNSIGFTAPPSSQSWENSGKKIILLRS